MCVHLCFPDRQPATCAALQARSVCVCVRVCVCVSLTGDQPSVHSCQQEVSVCFSDLRPATSVCSCRHEVSVCLCVFLHPAIYLVL